MYIDLFAVSIFAVGRGLKYAAHSWASSKLEKEESRTQSLLRELDRAKADANEKVQATKNDYSRKIKAYQDKREKELNSHIDFVNEQLNITAGYLPELNQFQSFTLTCVDSWVHVDLCQQKIDIATQKIDAIMATIGLLDAYVSELNRLFQRQERQAWREFTETRALTVTSDFVAKTKARIDRTSKSSHHEFQNEIKRFQSHRNALNKDANALRIERNALLKSKTKLVEQHKANKKALAENYKSCVEQWSDIAKALEGHCGFEVSELDYVNEWIADLRGAEEAPTIKRLIAVANESVRAAKEHHSGLERERNYYALRISQAHNSKEYPETFSNDKMQRNKFKQDAAAAWADLDNRCKARQLIYDRKHALLEYNNRIKPLHPDAAIDAIYEMLNSDREFNAWLAFGINTSKQKRKHWEMKQNQNRIENAPAN